MDCDQIWHMYKLLGILLYSILLSIHSFWHRILINLCSLRVMHITVSWYFDNYCIWEQWKLWLLRLDAQASLCLCCPHTTTSDFLTTRHIHSSGALSGRWAILIYWIWRSQSHVNFNPNRHTISSILCNPDVPSNKGSFYKVIQCPCNNHRIRRTSDTYCT